MGAALAVTLFALPMPAGAQTPVDLELVLAADGSGSIDDDELALQREGYARALTDPRMLEAIQGGILGRIAVAYTEWGGPDSQHTIVDWMVISDPASAAAFADRLRAAPRQAFGYNSISGAIDHAADKIRSNPQIGRVKIIDVSGDGPQIGGRPVEAARDDAVAEGITINALTIQRPGGGYRGPGGMPLDLHYRLSVIGGAGAFVMVADETRSFADAVFAKMFREIAWAAATSRRLAAAGAHGVSAPK